MSDLNLSISSSGLMGAELDKISARPVKDTPETENQVAAIKATELKAEPEKKELAAEDVEVAVEEANAFVQNMQRNLSFTVDEELGEPIISVKDMETDEVIRQIPSEELVVLRKKMDDVVGILFDTKV